ncbi:MAG: DUF3108 domain-containing protein, partial [Muribaculaceae bacterium]|nr:DUF3108 domain-containing protein [Muribaculaceae bacterium]
MKKILLSLVALCIAFVSRAQGDIPYTEINYNVHYHWGFVDVMIAHGVVGMQKEGDRFSATLDGNSIPWNGRVFCVSDTLKATMTPGNGLPSETVDYINGWYLKPKVTLYRSHGFDPSNPANYKNIKGGGNLDASPETMEAITVTADMLGLFYYFREIDFNSMSDGQQITIPIVVSGGSPEKVVVTYNGKSSFKTDDASYPTYSVRFEYSYGGRMSGYPVDAQVSAENRLPVLISASLPIGKVEMIYHP